MFRGSGVPDRKKRGTNNDIAGSLVEAVNPTDSSEKSKPIVRWGRKAQGSFLKELGRTARLPEKTKEEK